MLKKRLKDFLTKEKNMIVRQLSTIQSIQNVNDLNIYESRTVNNPAITKYVSDTLKKACEVRRDELLYSKSSAVIENSEIDLEGVFNDSNM